MKLWYLLGFILLVACSGPAKNIEVKAGRPVEPATETPKDLPAKKEAVHKPKAKRVRGKRRRPKKATKSTVTKNLTSKLVSPNAKRDLNRYSAKMKRLFLRVWVVPSQLTDTQLEELKAVVRLRYDDEFKVSNYSISGPSRSDSFDDSIHVAIEAIMNNREQQPEPAESIQESLQSAGLLLRINGQDATNDW